jgi:hypothetical protein
VEAALEESAAAACMGDVTVAEHKQRQRLLRPHTASESDRDQHLRSCMWAALERPLSVEAATSRLVAVVPQLQPPPTWLRALLLGTALRRLLVLRTVGFGSCGCIFRFVGSLLMLMLFLVVLAAVVVVVDLMDSLLTKRR